MGSRSVTVDGWTGRSAPVSRRVTVSRSSVIGWRGRPVPRPGLESTGSELRSGRLAESSSPSDWPSAGPRQRRCSSSRSTRAASISSSASDCSSSCLRCSCSQRSWPPRGPSGPRAPAPGVSRSSRSSIAHSGGRLAGFGPSKNPNFPFVLLGRARFHGALVAARTHARRDVMELPGQGEGSAVPLEAGQQRGLASVFGALRKHAPGSPRYRAAIDELTGIVDAILREDERRPLA